MSPPSSLGAALDAARRALQTVETSDPRTLRLEALRVIERLVDADGASFVRYDLDDGLARYAASGATRADADRTVLALEGHPALIDVRRHLDPLPEEVNHFVTHEWMRVRSARLRRPDFLTMPLPPDHPLHRAFYGPLGIRDELRGLLYDGRRMLGRVAFHFESEGRTGPEPQILVNRVAPELQALLAAAESLERRVLDPTPQLIVRATGRVEFTTAASETWLTAERRERLGELVRTAEREGTFDPRPIIDGVRASMVRMYGQGVVYLVALRPTVSPELAAVRLLTPRQREIAEYAVAGATTREIGEALSLSTETVRDHLKDIYRRLEVSSRVELAAALAVS